MSKTVQLNIARWLLFIYCFSVACGLDILLPNLKGLGFLKPSIVFTPLLLFAAVLSYPLWKNSVTRFKWIFGFIFSWVLLISLHFFFFSESGSAYATILGHYHFFVVLCLFLCIFMTGYYTDIISKALIYGVVLAASLNLLERIVLLPFTMQSTRSAGLFLNPNGAAESITFVIITLFMLAQSKATKVQLSIVAGIAFLGALVTMSRGGMILISITYVSLLCTRALNIKIFLRSVLIATLIFCASLLVFEGFKSMTSMTKSISEECKEIICFDTIISDNGAVSIMGERLGKDASASARLDLAADGIFRIFDENIVFGKGIGYLSNAHQRTHNFFIESWIEVGVFSLLFLPLLLVTLWRHKENSFVRIFVLVLIVDCGLSHNIVNSRVITIAFAAAIMTAFGKYRNDQQV